MEPNQNQPETIQPSQSATVTENVPQPAPDTTVPVATPLPPQPPIQSYSQMSKKPPVNKKALLAVLGILVLAAGVFGYIFAFYLPNQPDYAWNNGLSNSGKEITSVTNKLTEQKQLDKLKQTELAITAQITGDGYDYTGTVSSQFDSSKSSSQLNVKSGDKVTQKIDISAEVLTEIPAGKIYPDVYFKLSGLKNLQVLDIASTYGVYDSKWIHVSSSYLESIYKQSASQPAAKQDPVTSGDVAELVKTVSATSQDYLFTSDKSKAVFENKGFKGKEIQDGIQTFHYEVGVNEEHAKDYCVALSNRVLDLPIAKKLKNDDTALQKAKDNVNKDCDTSSQNAAKDSQTFDAWIDIKHHIIYKVREYNGSDKTIYYEFGQLYKGGDDLSLFFTSHNDAEQQDSKLVLDVNSKDIISKGTFTASKKAGSPYDIKATIEVKPHNGEVKVTKPTDVIEIQQLMSQLGGGTLGARTSKLKEVL